MTTSPATMKPRPTVELVGLDHFGQHLQGCVSCYRYTEERAIESSTRIASCFGTADAEGQSFDIPISGDALLGTFPMLTPSAGNLWHAPRVFASEVSA